MNELEYKHKILEALEFHGWRAQEHEDKHQSYIPDLSFSGNGTDGWIEVKYRDDPPGSLNAMDHWTRGQESWLYERGTCGSGNCFLLVGTEKRHVVWRYDVLRTIRYQSWTGALGYAFIDEILIAGLVDQLRRRVSQRGRLG